MSDIVEALRFLGSTRQLPTWGQIQRAADEIERLRERLEMDFAWQFIDGVKTKVKVEPGSIPDGIDCRNETIRLQDERYERMRDELQKLRAALSEPEQEGASEALGEPKASEHTSPNAREAALYEALAHGDKVHRAWLKEAIHAFYAGKPMPPPRALLSPHGGGSAAGAAPIASTAEAPLRKRPIAWMRYIYGSSQFQHASDEGDPPEDEGWIALYQRRTQ